MTAISKSLGQTSFHDATLIDMQFDGHRVALQIEGASRAGRQVPMRLDIDEVQSLMREGVRVDRIGMEAADGEILTFGYTGDHYVLIVEWNDFQTKSRHTVEYGIWGTRQAVGG